MQLLIFTLFCLRAAVSFWKFRVTLLLSGEESNDCNMDTAERAMKKAIDRWGVVARCDTSLLSGGRLGRIELQYQIPADKMRRNKCKRWRSDRQGRTCIGAERKRSMVRSIGRMSCSITNSVPILDRAHSTRSNGDDR